MSPLDDLFSQLGDQQIPGGCDQCDAYQTMETVSPGVHMIRVHHDDWCPFLRAGEAGSN
ncbi:MAG: hypothetical protein ACLQPH_05930 [Acidimicrobiales bacterium]